MNAIIQKVLKILSCRENILGSPISLLPVSCFPRTSTINNRFLGKTNLTIFNHKENKILHKLSLNKYVILGLNPYF